MKKIYKKLLMIITIGMIVVASKSYGAKNKDNVEVETVGYLTISSIGLENIKIGKRNKCDIK